LLTAGFALPRSNEPAIPRLLAVYLSWRIDLHGSGVFDMTRLTAKLRALKLSQLSALCAVCERKSFTDAARFLNEKPSTITRAIQSLEKLVGVPLVCRSRRYCTPTAAGEKYYELAKRMLTELQSTAHSLGGNRPNVRGWIRFTMPTVFERYLFPEILVEAATVHPELQFDIIFTDDFVDPAQAGLDFAVRGGYPSNSLLIAQTLWTYDRYLCASPSYVKRFGLARHPDELSNHSIVQHTGPRVLKDWHLCRSGEVIHFSVEPKHRVSSGIGLISLLERGLGVGQVASWLATSLITEGRLCRICPDYLVESRLNRRAEIHAVCRRGHLPKRAEFVIDLFKRAGRTLPTLDL
jgi:DNA-binding transcriptional LysR family regulator